MQRSYFPSHFFQTFFSLAALQFQKITNAMTLPFYFIMIWPRRVLVVARLNDISHPSFHQVLTRRLGARQNVKFFVCDKFVCPSSKPGYSPQGQEHRGEISDVWRAAWHEQHSDLTGTPSHKGCAQGNQPASDVARI